MSFYTADKFGQKSSEFSVSEEVILTYEVTNQVQEVVEYWFWAPLYSPIIGTVESVEIWSADYDIQYDAINVTASIEPYETVVITEQ